MKRIAVVADITKFSYDGPDSHCLALADATEELEAQAAFQEGCSPHLVRGKPGSDDGEESSGDDPSRQIPGRVPQAHGAGFTGRNHIIDLVCKRHGSVVLNRRATW